MEWLEQLKAAFGAGAAVLISMLITAVVYQSKKLNASELAHHLTKDQHGEALKQINEKTTAALLASAEKMAQFTELLRAKSSQ